MNEYYSDDRCTIYNADCAEVLPSLSDVDLVFTSPPYNLGSSPWPMLGNWKPGDGRGTSKWNNGTAGGGSIGYCDHDDAMPWVEYVGWQQSVLSMLWECLSPAGAIFYNHKPRVVGAQLWTPLELNPGLPLRQIITWARAGGLNFNATAFVPTYEWIMIFAKSEWRLHSQAASGIGDVWRVPAKAQPDHPAPFPIELPGRAIEATRPSCVLDPFMGSGTTLVAARSRGIRSIGIEKSERYCEVAAKRMCQEVLF